jgi:hypothetical protein
VNWIDIARVDQKKWQRGFVPRRRSPWQLIDSWICTRLL